MMSGRLVLALRGCGIPPERALRVAVELHRLDSIRFKKMPFLYAAERQRADRFTQVVITSRAWAVHGLAGVTELVESFV